MKEAFYFPHDVNAIQDPKMMRLLIECGVAGIGLYWIIIEILHQQEWGAIGYPDLTHYINFYGKQGAWDDCLLKKFEKVIFDTKLLILEGDTVFSTRVKNNKQRRIELQTMGRENALKRWVPNGGPLAPQCDPNAIKERKRKEKKDSIAKPLASTPPLQPTLTDTQKIVTAFKMLQGYDRNDKAWDKLNFARFSASAKKLLDFIGNWRDAIDCAQDIYEKFTSKGLTVTLETVCKHADTWKKDHQEKQGGSNGVFSLSGNGSSTIIGESALPITTT